MQEYAGHASSATTLIYAAKTTAMDYRATRENCRDELIEAQ